MNLKKSFGDAAGGITGVILAVPAAIALGPLIFAGLGPEYIPMGIAAAVISLGIANLGGALTRGNPVIISGPSLVGSLMLAAAFTSIADESGLLGGGPESVRVLFVLLFLLVLLSGAMQVAFGFLKLGFLVKYIPYPVLSGLLNGTAITIIISQAGKIFAAGDTGAVDALTLVLAAVTIGAIIIAKKTLKGFPAPLIGILFGVAAFWAFRASGVHTSGIQVVGNISATLPAPVYLAGFFRMLRYPGIAAAVAGMIPAAFSIAVINSLRTLITLVAIDGMTFSRSDADKELIGQGLSNMLSASFGGIAATGLSGSTSTNYEYGGRSRLSKACAGIFALALLVILYPVFGIIPRVVLAAVVLMFGISAFDRWSIQIFKRVIRGKGKKRHLTADLLLMVLVAVILVTAGIFRAVSAGILITLIVFAVKMGRDIVRRSYSAREIRSSVYRTQEELACLLEYGESILVIELDGALFFGTTDKLAQFIYGQTKRGIRYIILDFKRVSEVDGTGANILVQIKTICAGNGITLLLSSLRPDSAVGSFLNSAGVFEYISSDHIFDKTDHALSWAEDRIIGIHIGAGESFRELSLEELDVFREFDESDRGVITRYISEKEFGPGELVFRQGDEADGIYFIAKGRAHIIVREPGGGYQRISTLSRGTSFGEMSAIDGKPRSATVTAENILKCLFIPKDALEKLEKKKPHTAFKLMAGVSRELSMRFRISNRISIDFQ